MSEHARPDGAAGALTAVLRWVARSVGQLEAGTLRRRRDAAASGCRSSRCSWSCSRCATSRAARRSRSRVRPSPGSCSATRAPACSGCRSDCSSASPGSSRLAQVRRRRLDRRAAPRWQGSGRTPSRSREGGRPAITYEWYRDFIQTACSTRSPERGSAGVITFGELAVGSGCCSALLTGLAAFVGALMNMSFLLAGSASTNPVLFTLAIGLILAWKVAGYYGLDRFLLPMLGTPWHPGGHRGRWDAGTVAPSG